MTLERSKIGEVHVLTPMKNLVEPDETQSLMGIIDEVAAEGPAKIVVDLGKISWVNSVGFGGLWKANRTCSNSHGWLRLAGAGARITGVLHRIRLAFDTFETVEEAVAAEKRTKQP